MAILNAIETTIIALFFIFAVFFSLFIFSFIIWVAVNIIFKRRTK